jgi:hypothetical protein
MYATERSKFNSNKQMEEEMKLSHSFKKIAIVGLTAGSIFTSLFLYAQENDINTDATYVCIPLHAFNRLTETPEQQKTPIFYTYQDGKLTKCTTDLSKDKFQQCKKNMCNENKRFHKKMRKQRDNKFVLVTIDQLAKLKEQKIDQKIKQLQNQKENIATNLENAAKNATISKIDGKDAKIVTIRQIKSQNRGQLFISNNNSKQE